MQTKAPISRKGNELEIPERKNSPNPVGMTTTKKLTNILIRNWAISMIAKMEKLSNIKKIAVLADPK